MSEKRPISEVLREKLSDPGTERWQNIFIDQDRARELLAIVEAAKCIRHWHDREPEGMVVSAEHVRALWAALSAAAEEPPR